MAKRTRIEVNPAKGAGWDVTQNGKAMSHHRKKDTAVDAAAARGRQDGHAQVIIKKQDGRIQSERTYGSDPPKTKG
jgi:hypothetical protein